MVSIHGLCSFPVTNVTLEHHWGTQETKTSTGPIQTVLAYVPTSAAVERRFTVAVALKTAKRSPSNPKKLAEYNDELSIIKLIFIVLIFHISVSGSDRKNH